MSKYEVTLELIIHCQTKIVVEAASKDAALDAAVSLTPANIRAGSGAGWKAKIDVKAPKGVVVTGCKAIHFDTASGGGDKVRKLSAP